MHEDAKKVALVMLLGGLLTGLVGADAGYVRDHRIILIVVTVLDTAYIFLPKAKARKNRVGARFKAREIADWTITTIAALVLIAATAWVLWATAAAFLHWFRN